MPILIQKQLSKFSKLKNQTQKSLLKIQKPKKSLKSQNVRKLTAPNLPILNTKKSLGGPEGPSQVAKGHLEVAEGHQPSAGARRRAT